MSDILSKIGEALSCKTGPIVPKEVIKKVAKLGKPKACKASKTKKVVDKIVKKAKAIASIAKCGSKDMAVKSKGKRGPRPSAKDLFEPSPINICLAEAIKSGKVEAVLAAVEAMPKKVKKHKKIKVKVKIEEPEPEQTVPESTIAEINDLHEPEARGTTPPHTPPMPQRLHRWSTYAQGLKVGWWVTFKDGERVPYHSIRDMSHSLIELGLPVNNVESVRAFCRRRRNRVPALASSYAAYDSIASIVKADGLEMNLLADRPDAEDEL